MKFTPKTYQQINEESLIAPGTYPFEVVGAEDKKSKKSGADMIELKLRVFYEGDSFSILTDYLLEAMAYKLIHFCEGTGLNEKYINGTVTANDCRGKSGKCKVGVQKDKTGEYPPKNVIKDYICPENEPKEEEIVQDKPVDDTDVPF